MTYQEFNKKILDYYISRSSSTFFTLSLDKYELAKVIPLNEISKFEILKNTWTSVAIIIEGIPQYFGLIAIQCYAASLMHEDEINSAEAYQIRLCEILNLADSSQLQNLFRGGDINNPIQEQIWHNAKDFLNNNLNQKLDIPDKIYYAGRYVQYPKSQALLTTEDLKYFTKFFAEEFQLHESLSLDYFEDRLNKRFEYLEKTSRTERLWLDDNKRERCIKQVYNYYNLWDGKIFSPSYRKVSGVIEKVSNKTISPIKLILLFESGKANFYTNNKETNEIKEIQIEDIFKVKGYKYIYKALIIFTEFEYYPDEYEDSRFLYNSTPSFVLLDSNIRSQEEKYLKDKCSLQISLSQNLILFKYDSPILELHSPLNFLIQKNRSKFLEGGIKVNNKGDYLKGYGPSIIYENEYEIIYEYNKCNYDPETAAVGLYRIRADNQKDYEFSIIENKAPAIIINSKGIGWELNKYIIDVSFDIEGILINSSQLKESPHRRWINANIKTKRTKQENENNIIINAIYNSRK